MSARNLLCILGIHAWSVERTGEVPGAHVTQRYCRRCGQEKITYDIYDAAMWEEWVQRVTDNRLVEGEA